MDAMTSKILIVDDEPELREILVFDFENLGYIVKEAANANSALAQLDENPDIKVIVSDIRMPDGDGITLLKSIQLRQIKETVSLIFVTGFSDLKIDEAFNLGARGYITKPFDRRVLAATVKRLLVSEGERWSQVDTGLKENVTKLSLTFSNYNLAIQKHALSLGHGGMFIAKTESLPSVGAVIDFEIMFDEAPPKKIQGKGIVRWTRPSDKTNGPSGLGIEFLFLIDETRDFILNNEERRRQVAFIPIC
jgi:CheY-like chemotaxis protein/Tfp pilus assembly protein PilZ